MAALLVTMVVGAACGSSGGRTETVSPSVSPAPSTTSTPSATATPIAAGCGQVLATGTAFAAQLSGLTQGQTTLDQVKAAATQLRDAVDAAVTAATDAYRPQMTQLQSDLQALQSALSQTPVQLDSVRAAGRQVADTLTTLARPCLSATPTAS
jgi:hypothetical protein